MRVDAEKAKVSRNLESMYEVRTNTPAHKQLNHTTACTTNWRLLSGLPANAKA
jgi:hypothetical protein